MVKLNKAIFFDRDGTLIKTLISKKNKPIAIRDKKDFKLNRYAEVVIKNLSKKFLIFVFTNQPDVARQKNTKKKVKEINFKLMKHLSIKKIFTCYSDDDNNYMRKPNPGMIYLAKRKFKLNLKKSYVVGDTIKDIKAGKKARCKTIILRRIYNRTCIKEANYSVKNLYEILKIIRF